MGRGDGEAAYTYTHTHKSQKRVNMQIWKQSFISLSDATNERQTKKKPRQQPWGIYVPVKFREIYKIVP